MNDLKGQLLVGFAKEISSMLRGERDYVDLGIGGLIFIQNDGTIVHINNSDAEKCNCSLNEAEKMPSKLILINRGAK